jgi:transposase
MTTADTEMMNIFLAQFSQTLAPEVHAVVLLDSAGWHCSKKLQVPANLTLLRLPPYSPELNPAELPWREMRREHLSNRVFENEDVLEKGIGQAWVQITQDPQRVRSLCAFPWIVSSVIN